MTRRGYWPHDIARKMKETDNAKAKKTEPHTFQARGDPFSQRQMDWSRAVIHVIQHLAEADRIRPGA
jgi:hypothetical protein